MKVTGSIEFSKRQTQPVQLLLHSMFREVRFWSGDTQLTPRTAAQGTDNAYTLDLPLNADRSGPRLRFEYEGGQPSAQGFFLSSEASFASGFNTNWYPELDPGGKAVGTITVTAPQGYVVVAVGETGAGVSNTFKVTQPSYFWFCAARYSRVRKIGRPGSPPLDAFLLRARPDINADLEAWAAVVAFLTNRFGAYPFDALF